MIFRYRLMALPILLTAASPAAAQSQFAIDFDNAPTDFVGGYSDQQIFGRNVNSRFKDRNARVTVDPDDPNNQALRVRYLAGSYGHSSTGAAGADNGYSFSVPVDAADAYHYSFRVRFGSSDDGPTFNDFDWQLGGKLPGLYGGAWTSGGDDAVGDGWSVREMWKEDGSLIPYIYHMDKPGTFGDNLGVAGSPDQPSLTRGTWHHVAGFVQLNTDNNNDGILRLSLDGQEFLNRTDIRYRDEDTFGDDVAQIDVLRFVTFHGGNQPKNAPDVDSHAWFDDLRISSDRSFVMATVPEPATGGIVVAAVVLLMSRRRRR
jgi:hypothetical protein